MCVCVAMAIRRVRTREGWFADVPARHSDDRSAHLRVLSPEEHPDEGVMLQGHVLWEDATTSVVSCGGLLARVPRLDERQDRMHVRILVDQRAHAA